MAAVLSRGGLPLGILASVVSLSNAACFVDPVYSLSIKVEVPAPAQRSFTPYPAQLLLADGNRWGSASRLAVLCSPADIPVVAEYMEGGICGMEKEYVAWLMPHDAPAAELRCGLVSPPQRVFYDEPKLSVWRAPAAEQPFAEALSTALAGWPNAKGVAFRGKRGSSSDDCGRAETLRLILSAPPARQTGASHPAR